MQHDDDDSHCSSIVDPEQLRSSTLQSICYLASHVPTIVLTRLKDEVMESNEDDEFHWSTSFEEDLHEEEVPVNDETQSNASELSDISDLSHEDESENDVSPIKRRVALHDTLEKGGEENRKYLDEAQFPAQDVEDRAPSHVRQELRHDPDIQSPFRCRRHVRVSSMTSVSSNKNHIDCPGLPFATRCEASLLFVDISGFTLLSNLLALEDLSKAINEYFELIVNEVTEHGGDILKFAGDGLFAMWKVKSHGSNTEKLGESNYRMNIDECITAAAVCGSKIVSKFSGHPISVDGKVKNGRENTGLVLNVHCGISLGALILVHVGDNDYRRENVILGKPITEVSHAAAHAKIGEVAACPASIKTLARICKMHDSIDMSKSMTPVVIADRNAAMFTTMKTYTPRNLLLTETDPLASKLGRLVHGLDLPALLRYRKLLALYVHPVVAANDVGNVAIIRAATGVGERVIEEAELRNVFVMFIAPMISVTPSGDSEKDSHLFDLLNSIMNLTTRELTRFGGQLRQYIVDDKGLVLIATLGLRGSTFPHMVAERALPMATSIQNILLSDLEVQSRIGATVGNAYCGVVGGLMRHEYAVLGPSVNLAARLMDSLKGPGMRVDNAIRLLTYKSYDFGALSPVGAKGYAEPVAIFEPRSPLQKNWGRRKPNFVGRRQELQTMAKIASDIAMSSGHTSARLVLITGPSGMGKSTLVVHLLGRIQRSLEVKKKRISILKYVSKDSDRLSPFGAFGSILLDALVASDGFAGDDNSFMSSSNSIRSWSSFSAMSSSLKARIAAHVSELCNDFGGTPDFAKMVCQHLLNINVESKLNSQRQDFAATKLSVVTFLCKAFLRCTQDADLVLIALDDVHLTDEMSFKVIQELFESGSKLMIICTSRPLSAYRLAIDKAFWMKLHTDYASNGRFLPVELTQLSAADMRTMIGNTLGINEDDISERLQRTIHAQSGGMPQFGHVLLEHLKKVSLPAGEMNRGSKFSNLDQIAEATAETTLRQIIIQKIDSLSGAARKLLNVAAVIGLTFSFEMLVAVIVKEKERIIHLNSKEVKAGARIALLSAVKEGILDHEYNGCENTADPPSLLLISNQKSSPTFENSEIEDIRYCFSHDVWRSTILELMLDERKRHLHKIVALTLESTATDDAKDYNSRLRLFSHLKSSGDVVNASAVALDAGKVFEDFGLHHQCIELYHETLEMWENASIPGSNEHWFTADALIHLSAEDITACVKLYIALGKALANLHRPAEAVQVYQRALSVLKEAKNGGDIADRRVVFPIFSGLFILLKMGHIKQDEACSYEQGLVARFVDETKASGDPVHYTRALAMQAETFARLGDFECALLTQYKARAIYDPEKHSASICKAYGSDRTAQCISLSAIWHVEVGNIDEALRTCDFVICELMPKMEPSNVHNSGVILSPVIWILKDNGMALKAKDLFEKYVVNAFNQYFDEGATTFLLAMYDPTVMMLDLHGNQGGEVANLDRYLSWALCDDNLRFGDVIKNAMLIYGLELDCISAEICLLLARRVNNSDQKETLIKKGLLLSQESAQLASHLKAVPSLRRARPVLRELMEAAKELGLVTELESTYETALALLG